MATGLEILGVVFPSVLPLAGILLMLVLSLVALAYMLGSLFSNEQVKTWARMELTEVFYSAVILALGISILTLTDSSIAAFINGSHPMLPGSQMGVCDQLRSFPDYADLPCHIGIAKNFFSTVFDQGVFYLYTLLRQYNRFAYLAGISVTADSVAHVVGSVSFSPFSAYLHIPISVYGYMFDFGIRSLMLLKFQEILIEFVNDSIFPTFFVVGTILRAFPVMRRLGGLMMAIGICFYYVFPAFYGLGSAVFTGMMIADISNGGLNNGDGYVMDWAEIKFDPQMNMDALAPEAQLQQRYANGEVTVVDPATGASYDQDAIARGDPFVFNEQNSNMCRPSEDNRAGFGAWDEWTGFVGLLLKLIFFPFSGFAWGENFDEWILGEHGIVNGVARMVFFSFFFSFLSVMSTIAAIKGLSPLLGGDTEIAGLTHLV